MSNKKYINLWFNTSQKGNDYLRGKDKDTGSVYFVFNDKEGGKTLKIKENGADNFTKEVSLEERNSEHGSFYAGQGVTLGANRFYIDDEDPEEAINGDIRYITDQQGNLRLGRDGKPLEKPTHRLALEVG